MSDPSTQIPNGVRDQQALRAGLAVFALYHLALAAYMAFAPHSFYTQVGPFGARNDHYVRDVASFTAALGVGFLLAQRRASWRVPVLAITTVQFALHSVNHLLDIGKAHPRWAGYFDFFSLLAATLLLAWLWRIALEQDRHERRAQLAEPLSPFPRRSPQRS
jgi:hypothetical protein